MSVAPGLFSLVGGVLAFLVLASAVALGFRLRRGAGDPLVANLCARIAAWWVMVALLALALCAGPAGVLVLFAALSALALREFLAATLPGPLDPALALALFGVALPVQFGAVHLGLGSVQALALPMGGLVALPAILAWRSGAEGFTARVGAAFWGMMLCLFGLAHLPALALLPLAGGVGAGVLLVAWLVLVVQAGDVAQYIWGKLLGRRPLAPVLSPSKTREGFLGGTASAVVLGAVLSPFTPFAPWQAAALALAATLAGTLGGLILSAVKRDRGVKDWGHVIAGHGGFLDRLDSLVLSAPLVFLLVQGIGG